MSLGVFGGTFDPIHCGHLAVARAVRERFALERVLLVPAWRPPHKRGEDLTAWAHRFAMAAVACLGQDGVEASPVEGHLAGTSYTVETLRSFREERGPAEPLIFVMGSDSLADLPSWKDSRRILELASLAVAPRPGADRDEAASVLPRELARLIEDAGEDRTGRAPLPAAGRIYWLPMEPVDLSGSSIRSRLRAGEGAAGLVPEAVAAYIARYGLYASRRNPSET